MRTGVFLHCMDILRLMPLKLGSVSPPCYYGNNLIVDMVCSYVKEQVSWRHLETDYQLITSLTQLLFFKITTVVLHSLHMQFPQLQYNCKNLLGADHTGMEGVATKWAGLVREALHSMGGVVVLYTCVFVLYSLMDVLGLMPQELRSAGVTLPALFARYYGDQVKVASMTSDHAWDLTTWP